MKAISWPYHPMYLPAWACFTVFCSERDLENIQIPENRDTFYPVLCWCENDTVRD
jgi:hypothetical protein